MVNLFIAELSSSFETNPTLFIFQALNFLFVVAYFFLVFKAGFRAADRGKGMEVPIWLFAIVLLPIFGAIATLVHFKKEQS